MKNFSCQKDNRPPHCASSSEKDIIVSIIKKHFGLNYIKNSREHLFEKRNSITCIFNGHTATVKRVSTRTKKFMNGPLPHEQITDKGRDNLKGSNLQIQFKY